MVEKEDIGLLLHTLGLSDPSSTQPSYRNHFVASDWHADLPGLLRLVSAGLMEERPSPQFLPRADRLFVATDLGKAEAERQRPRLSRAKQRYLSWLRISDVCPDLTFGDYLKGARP